MAKAQLRTRLSSVLNASRHTVIFHVTVFFCLQQLDALAKFELCVLRTLAHRVSTQSSPQLQEQGNVSLS